MATKTRTILNLEDDVKDISKAVLGKPFVLGPNANLPLLDLRGKVGQYPSIEVTADEWRKLQSNAAAKASLDYWLANNQIRID